MKSNLDKFFKANESLEKNGVWFDIDENTGFLLRPFKSTNPRMKAALATHFKPFARQAELGTLEINKQLEINARAFIDVCLVDWKGVDIDDAPAECNPSNALKLFMALPDLFDALWKHAQDAANYKEVVGNS